MAEHDAKHAGKGDEHSHGGGHGGGHSGGGHGGGGGHEEHEGAPEWLISFADNVTLLMGFFVIMLASAMKPPTYGTEDKKGEPDKNVASSATNLDVAIAIRSAFNNPVDPDSTNPIDLPLIQRLRERAGESDANQRGPEGLEHDIKSIRPGRYFVDGGRIPFADDSAALTETTHRAVAAVAAQLRGVNMVIEIRGHVSVPEAKRSGDGGYRLSYERAAAVAAELEAAGLRRSQIQLTACADTDRLVARAYSGEQHQSNARVEVTLTDEVTVDGSRIENAPIDEEKP